MGNWYFNRLRTMSPAEIYYRIRRLISGYLEEKIGYDTKFDRELFKSKRNILGLHKEDLKICINNFKIFGTGFNFTDPADINWHRDILSGEVYSLSFYRKINILENQNLSAKSVWEINRLQFLTGICMNYKVMKNRGELDLFMQLNKSWSLNNPFLIGVNWYSNIEVNLRLITWFFCWEILDTENLMSEDLIFRQFVENDWLPLIRKHCLYSYKNPSKYSSANNHLVSEYAGLFIASSKWQFRESEEWINYSQNGLENEIIRQNSEEGINREEAAEYIQFITDFFLISYIVGEKTNRSFTDKFRQQLYKIFCYIFNILDCRGNFPKYGDEDDGKCFILDFDEKHNNFKSLLTSGAIIFKDPLLKTKSNGFDYKNHLLFSDQGKMIYESIPDLINKENSIFYREDGHFIFRKKEDGDEIYMHFDAAPLGYLSIAAHGHADALSCILHVDGQPVFIDPGTYTYHTEPEWRQYFIGTLAHNTVRINQKNQAENGGPTLWIKHYKAFVIDVYSGSDIDRVKATHNGYLKDNAQHIREIVFDKIKNEFKILDTIVVKEKERIQLEILFHIHPDVSISRPAPDFFLLSSGQSRKTEFHVDEKLDPVIIKGQTEPRILGWYSDSFLKKEATAAIYCKTFIESTATFKFIIKII